MPNDTTHLHNPETPDLEFLVNHVNEDTDEVYVVVFQPQAVGGAYDTVRCGRSTLEEAYVTAHDSRVELFYVQETEPEIGSDLPPYELTIVLKFAS